MNKNAKVKLGIIIFLFLVGIFCAYFVFAGESLEPFTITERTEYGILENIRYTTITENLGKDQIIDINDIFHHNHLTQQIFNEQVLLNQSYEVNIYGIENVSLGKYKQMKDGCVVNLNGTICTTDYYDDLNNLMDCDYVLEDKSCLKLENTIIGTEIRYDYLPIPSLKEKLIIDSKKIEMKSEGIPLPKNSIIQIKTIYSHPLAILQNKPTDLQNKYNITVCSNDGLDCSTLDPTWFNSSWSKCRNISIQASATKNNYPMIKNDFTAINLTGLTFSSTNEIRIVNDSCNGGGIEMPYDVIQNGSTWAEVIFLANVTNGNITYSVYYDNTGVSAPSYSTDLASDSNTLENNHFTTDNSFNYYNPPTGWYANGGNTLILKIKQGSNTDMIIDNEGGYFGCRQFSNSGTCTQTFNGFVMDKINCVGATATQNITYYLYSNNPYIDMNVNTNINPYSIELMAGHFNGTINDNTMYTKAGTTTGGWSTIDPLEGWAIIYDTSRTNEIHGTIWNYSYTGGDDLTVYLPGYAGWRIGENPVNTKTMSGGDLFIRDIIGTLDDVANKTEMENIEYALFVENPFIYSIGAEETEAPTDTCTCAGLNENWEIDLSDYCILSTACNLGTGTLNFTGTGNFTCDAQINTTNLGDVGNGNILWVNNNCEVLIS